MLALAPFSWQTQCTFQGFLSVAIAGLEYSLRILTRAHTLNASYTVKCLQVHLGLVYFSVYIIVAVYGE